MKYTKLGITSTCTGFTLIELLLYMGIVSLFLLVLTQVFSSIVEVQVESQTATAVERDSRFLFAKLSQDIYHATSITTPATDGSTATSLVLSVAGGTVTYARNADTLERTDSGGTERIHSIHTVVPSFSIQRIGNSDGKDTVRVTFTIRSDTTQTPDEQTITFTVGPR